MKVGTFVSETNYFRIVNNTKVNVKREIQVANPIPLSGTIFSGGADGTRTRDLLRDRQAL